MRWRTVSDAVRVTSRVRRIERMMSPRSVAVVGASTRPGPGRKVLENLSRIGFTGAVYAVNRSRHVIDGSPTVSSLSELPEVPDLVVVGVNSAASVSVVGEAASLGCEGVVLLASGFGEIGPEGAALGEKVLAERREVALLGPNCLGFVNVRTRVAAYSGPMLEGSESPAVVLVSNSGAMACSLTGAAAERHIGLSHVITTGNQLDLRVSDFVRYAAGQEHVKVVACYLEGFDDGRALLEALGECSAAGKTVVVLKSGRSSVGARASRSHTGALAGRAPVQAELFTQRGVVMTEDPDEFLCVMELGQWHQRSLSVGRIGAATISGGERLLLSDAGEAAGLWFAELGAETKAAMREVLPSYADIANPLDSTGAGIVEGDTSAHTKAVGLLAADRNVDVLLACQDAKNGWVDSGKANVLFVDAVRAAIVAGEAAGKPVVVVSPTSGSVDTEARALLAEHGVPCLMGLTPAVRALGKFYASSREEGTRTRDERSPLSSGGATRLSTRSVLERFSGAGIDHWPTSIVSSVDEAVDAAVEYGFPVVLKLEAGLAHRRAVGGVQLGLRGPQEVKRAWSDLHDAALRSGLADPVQMSVQRLAFGESELFVGAIVDEQFGPIVLVGPGGSGVEAGSAFVVVLAPVDRARCEEALGRLVTRWDQGANAIKGAWESIIDVVTRVGGMVCDHGVRTVDVNPLLVWRTGMVSAIDAKITTTGSP